MLQPVPDPAFVRELKLIDPTLRVVWGYQRYLKRCWAIERRMTPERYHTCYRSLLESGEKRFVTQPIIDDSRPIYDEEGEIIDYEIVGERQYDLAPEWECLRLVESRDGNYKPLGTADLLALRREYAWNRNHPYSRERFEAEERRKAEEKERDQQRKRLDGMLESVYEAWHEHDLIVTNAAYPARVMPGTEV